jgi:hypothetical protein
MSNVVQFSTKLPPTEEERWTAVAFICSSLFDLEYAKTAVKLLLWTLIQNREGATRPPEFRKALLDFFGEPAP